MVSKKTNKKSKKNSVIPKKKNVTRRNRNMKRKISLMKQIKDNPWMKDILRKKAKREPLNSYDKYLYSVMKKQPLPKGGITKLIQKYK